MQANEAAAALRELASKIESGIFGQDVCFDDIMDELETVFEEEL